MRSLVAIRYCAPFVATPLNHFWYHVSCSQMFSSNRDWLQSLRLLIFAHKVLALDICRYRPISFLFTNRVTYAQTLLCDLCLIGVVFILYWECWYITSILTTIRWCLIECFIVDRSINLAITNCAKSHDGLPIFPSYIGLYIWFFADKFIAFKTPLDHKYDDEVPDECKFNIQMFLSSVKTTFNVSPCTRLDSILTESDHGSINTLTEYRWFWWYYTWKDIVL